MTSWEVYLITRLDAALIAMVVAIAAFLIIALCVAAESYERWDDDKKKRGYKTARRCLYASALLLVAVVATPSTKQAAVIYALPVIANSDVIKRDVPELYDMAIEYVKSKLKPQ